MADDKKISKQKQPKEEKQVKEPKVTIKDVAETLKDANKEVNETLSRNTNILKEIGEVLKSQNVNLKSIDVNSTTQTKLDELSKRDDYQIEQKEDANFILLKEQNELLNQILNAIGKSNLSIDDDNKKKKFDFSFDDALGWMLGYKAIMAIKNGIKRAFTSPLIGKIFSKAGAKGLAKKVFGWVFLPLQAAMMAFDFKKGWDEGEIITGRKGLQAKFDGAIYQVGSGLLLGLVSPKQLADWDKKIDNYYQKNIKPPIVKWITEMPKRFKRWFDETFSIETARKLGESFMNQAREFEKTIQSIPRLNDAYKIVKDSYMKIKKRFVENLINPLLDLYRFLTDKLLNLGISMGFIESSKDFAERANNFFEKNTKPEPWAKIGVPNIGLSDMANGVLNILRNKVQRMGEKKEKANKQTRSGFTGGSINNNINTFNSNVTNNRIVDMSTFSDDHVNMSPIFNFGLGIV